jgi:hypothetical protein
MNRLLYIVPIILLVFIIAPNADAQIQIEAQDCPDKCESDTLYQKGTWDSRLRRCVYAIETECKYGCERDRHLIINRDVPKCAIYPDDLPDNETEARDVIFKIVKEVYDRDLKKATVNIFGTEYQRGDNGTIFVQLLDADKYPINDGLCYVDIFNPDKTVHVDDGFMMYLNNSDGLYYYDLTIPNNDGVYMLSASCSFYNNLTYYPIVQDAYVYENLPNQNYGSVNFLAIGNFSTYASYIQIQDSIALENLESATMYLYAFFSAGNLGTIQRVTEEWNESNITWNNRPAHDPYIWENISASGIGWHAYNITELIRSWSNGTYTNYGMLLNCSAVSTNITDYYSTNYAGALKPEFILVYHTVDQITEIKGSGELHVSNYVSELNESIITNINNSIDNLNNISVEDIWTYGNRTVNLTEIVNLMTSINQSIQDSLNDINQTIVNKLDILETYILGLENLTASDVWSFGVRNLTYYPPEETINYSLIQDYVWNASIRELTNFSFVVNINDSDIITAIMDANSSIIDSINLSENNIINQVDAHNATIMNKLYLIQDEIAGLNNITAEAIWSYSNRTLTDFQFTVNINETNLVNFLTDMNDTITDNQDTILTEILGINTTVSDIYSLVLNLTIGNVTVSAQVNWSEGELVLHNISSPIQQYTDIVSFQSQQTQYTVTTDVCLSNGTLQHIVNSTQCYLNNCYSNIYSSLENCAYGCSNNMCLPAPWMTILIALAISVAVVVLIYILTRSRGRTW